MPAEYFEARERALLGERYELLYAAPQETGGRGGGGRGGPPPPPPAPARPARAPRRAAGGAEVAAGKAAALTKEHPGGGQRHTGQGRQPAVADDGGKLGAEHGKTVRCGKIILWVV